jgi:DNA-binding MarR family transcriptional regulator
MIHRLEKALEYGRTLDAEVQCNHLLTLLYVARRPGCTMTELWDYLQITSGAGSRLVSKFTEYGAHRVKGLNLLSCDTDPDDRRLKRVTLTPKGAQFVRHLLDLIDKG